MIRTVQIIPRICSNYRQDDDAQMMVSCESSESSHARPTIISDQTHAIVPTKEALGYR